MRGVIMYAPGDVRVEDRENPTIIEPTDADHPRSPRPASAARTCGRTAAPSRVDHTPMGHEYVGVVDGDRRRRQDVTVGDFVVGSFFASDNTCEICRAGYQSHCVHRHPVRRPAPRPSTPASRSPTAPSSPPPGSPTPT